MVVDGASHSLGVYGLSEFDESCSLVQDIPDDFANSVSDGPDCLEVSEAHDEALKNGLQVAPFGPDCRLSGLTQQAAQEAIAFGGTTGVVLPGTIGWNRGIRQSRMPVVARTGISWAASAPTPGISIRRMTAS